ncbi:unnamed protein product [Rotaria magnacalcarata]|uniref:Uncharacterized protein n=2 Tax=Rotaria magnacalcarata TaxID=392030 RepID=A0A8S2UZ39_9BILA|nr:unnamed protein product [Rotaria magnacalcarata]
MEDSPSSSTGEFWSSLLRIKDSNDVYEPFVQCTICQQILSYDINLPKSTMPIDCYTNKIATVSSDDKRMVTLACSKCCAFDMRSFNSGLMKTIKPSADILIPDRTNISRTIKQIANEHRLKMNEILRQELKQMFNNYNLLDLMATDYGNCVRKILRIVFSGDVLKSSILPPGKPHFRCQPLDQDHFKICMGISFYQALLRRKLIDFLIEERRPESTKEARQSIQ